MCLDVLLRFEIANKCIEIRIDRFLLVLKFVFLTSIQFSNNLFEFIFNFFYLFLNLFSFLLFFIFIVFTVLYHFLKNLFFGFFHCGLTFFYLKAFVLFQFIFLLSMKLNMLQIFVITFQIKEIFFFKLLLNFSVL